MKKVSLLKTRLSKCPYCKVLIARHLIYPDDSQCVYMQDKEWKQINAMLDKVKILTNKKTGDNNVYLE